MNKPTFYRRTGLQLILLLLIVAGVTALAPLEKTLGSNARIVYLHGAWVWAAMVVYLGAAVTGLLGLLTRRPILHEWSQALGRTGLLYWVVNLLLSLYVMQANWNGLFLEEPRFRLPLNFAIVSLLLQVGLSFFPEARWTSLGNLLFGIALFVSMNGVQAVLHPDSPVFSSGSQAIQAFFVLLLILLLATAWQTATLWRGSGSKQAV